MDVMSRQVHNVDGVGVPCFLYGTAWKEDATQRLARAGDPAGIPRRRYGQPAQALLRSGVGQAIRASIESGMVARDELFLQTKFTFIAGQDHRLPYDPQAPIPTQVEQSFASSLEHLGVEIIDSYLLHGPTARSA